MNDRLLRARSWSATLLVSALLAGCGSGVTTPSATGSAAAPDAETPTATTTATPTRDGAPVVRFDDRVTAWDGRAIRARCIGDGTPTILLEGGDGGIYDFDRSFIEQLAETTTVCHYSRPGGPGSDPVNDPENPRTVNDLTRDAYAVLGTVRNEAGVEPPYVFVGWSFGALISLAEALADPHKLAGIVVLDSDFPADFLRVCPTSGRSEADCLRDYEEDIDARAFEQELVAKLEPLDVPGLLVTAMTRPDCVDTPGATASAEISGSIVVGADCADLEDAIAERQIADWSREVPGITQTRVSASQDELIIKAGPDIADLIGRLIAEIRATA